MNNRRLYLAAIALILVFVASGLYLQSRNNQKTQPQRKTDTSEPGPSENKDEQNAKWFIQFTVKNQKTTAYTEEVSAPRPSSGKSYFIGGIAVHPRYPVNDGGDPRVPILPYGTVIHLAKPINVQGQEFTALTVMDTGDINYGLWPGYPYWFDIYYGNTQYYNVKNAKEFGTDLADYYWFEEWK
ncbi:MAG: hypothetical protein ABFD08_12900 [Syntrophomonas sp.]